MTVRPEVQRLVDMGPFPASDVAEEHDIDLRGDFLDSIARPVSQEEASALLACFGPDEAFGLAWSLLHLIETAEGGIPLTEKPSDTDNEWVHLLWDRSHR